MNFLVFDTETTGIPKHPRAKAAVQPRIIEFGGLLVDERGERLDSLELLIDPGIPLESVITKITGLTDDDLKGQPSFAVQAELIRPLFHAADVLVAHNLPFDKTMFELEIARCGIKDWPWPAKNICTVQEHAEEWGYRPKLLQLYEYYLSTPLKQTHRALDDVGALVEICNQSGILRND